jgi:CBS domain-containing protein
MNVNRYEGGKTDWKAAGLPTDGKQARTLRAGQVTRTDVPTCALTDSLDDVRRKIEASEDGFCVVVTDQGVVLGRVREGALEEGKGTTAEDVMEEGPTAIRPGEDLIEITNRLHDRSVDVVLVTKADGVLVGALYREDAEEAIHASNAGARG